MASSTLAPRSPPNSPVAGARRLGVGDQRPGETFTAGSRPISPREVVFGIQVAARIVHHRAPIGRPDQRPPRGRDVDVVVQPLRGFVIEGRDRASVQLPPQNERVTLTFEVRAVVEGHGLIRVLALGARETIGKVDVPPLVTPAPARRRSENAADLAPALVPSTTQQPDIQLLIAEDQAGGSLEYVIRVIATDEHLSGSIRASPPFALRLDPSTYFADFLGDRRAPLETPRERAEAERMLASKGAKLTDMLMPPELQQRLWDARERIGSIIVQSEEPLNPWELCTLMGRRGRSSDSTIPGRTVSDNRWAPRDPFQGTAHDAEPGARRARRLRPAACSGGGQVRPVSSAAPNAASRTSRRHSST